MRLIHDIKSHTEKRRKLRKAATPHEMILWSYLRRNRLGYKFRRQHSIGRYIVDFYCPEKKFIIELDGWQHEEDQKSYDRERTRYLESLGFKVIRFWNGEINRNLEGVMIKIQEHL